MNEKEISKIIGVCQPFTSTNKKRQLDLIQKTIHCVENGVGGDYVETGVFRGGSSMSMASVLQHYDKLQTLWMYDTYEGMPQPNKDEVKLSGKKPALQIYKDRMKLDEGWCKCSLEQVKKNMDKHVGYPYVKYIKGMVEDTLPKHKPNKIALLRLDTDFYESTAVSLEYLYPRLVSGGYIMIDDYGAFSGCRKAVDDYFKNKLPKFEYKDGSAIGFFKP